MPVPLIGMSAPILAGPRGPVVAGDGAPTEIFILADMIERLCEGSSDPSIALGALVQATSQLILRASAAPTMLARQTGAMLDACVEESLKSDGRVCRVCGCTHSSPCAGGCSWVQEDLCSACAGRV